MSAQIQQYYMQKVIIFRDRHPLIGPIFWLLSLQYYVTQFFVGFAWNTPYSLSKNTISDLGNTACGLYNNRYVCSPLHNWMNASFILLGMTMLFGSFFITSEFRRSIGARTGFYGMGLAGLGTLTVGVFPENTIGILHLAGAALPFFFGNIALVFFSFALRLPPGFRYYTLLSGIIALVDLAFLLAHQYLGLGLGGMERLVAYPQTVWLIAFGWYMSLNHFRLTREHTITYS